jgi:glycerol-3-phosphate dehydrogenase (NAD(P)+)
MTAINKVTTRHIAVLGSGSWGTALAVHLARAGQRTRLWGRDPALVEDMRAKRLNSVYLPEVPFPVPLEVTLELSEAIGDSKCVVAAVPSHGVRNVLQLAAPYIHQGLTVVSAVKGLERDSLLRVSEIIEQECGPQTRVAVLSGPSFARELAQQMPTAVSVASRDLDTVAEVQRDFRSSYFRLYGTADVVGVEIGGALKNVIAIAAGVAEGLGLGESARAGLITRGLAEITRLACAVGASRETLSGLTGLGDLVLTCNGSLSRNRRVGVELGKGRSIHDVMASMRMVAEGVRTTEAALALASKHRVEIPIAAEVAQLLGGFKDPRAALEDLMLRPQRPEVG